MSNPAPTFEDFAAVARARGFDDIVERRWDADTVVAEHRHPFSVEALLVQGEMWLTAAGGEPRHLCPGDRFELDLNAPHAERYGSEGAIYWAARRTGR